MTSIQKKKNLIEEKKNKPGFVTKLQNFLSTFVKILIGIVILYAVAPPIFFSARFMDQNVANHSVTYGENKYKTFEEFVDNEIKCSHKVTNEYKKKGETCPEPSKRLVIDNIKDVFEITKAKAFFSSRDTFVTVLNGLRTLLGFDELDKNIFTNSPTRQKSMLDEMKKINAERKNKDLMGNLGGAILMLCSKLFYIVSPFIVAPISTILTLFTLFTSFNNKTLVKTGLLFLWPLVFFWLFFIPPLVSLTIFIGLISLICIGTSIMTYGYTFYNWWKVLVSPMFWLPSWLNTYFRQHLTGKQRDAFEKTPFMGAKYEYPMFAREYKTVIIGYFTIMSLIALLGTMVG